MLIDLRKLFWPLILVTAVLAAYILWSSTPQSMGLVNDSAAYISGARSLAGNPISYSRLGGDGEPRPITHFPPLYSLALAAAGTVWPDPVEAARWLNVGLFAINIILAGLLARRATRSAVFGWLGAAFFALSEPLLRAHTFVLSEPLFLALSMGSMLALAGYLEGKRRPIALLVLAADLAALSYLTRYVGAALLAVSVLALLIGHRTWKARLRAAGVYIVSALPWIAAWSIRNALLTGSATNRSLNWHPVALDNLLMGLRNVWEWLLPSRLGLYDRLPASLWAAALGLGLLVTAAGVLLLGWRVLRGGTFPGFSWAAYLAALHALGYLAMLFLSMSFVDASTTFENRILAPFFADLVVLGVCLLSVLWKNQRENTLRYAVPLVTLVMLLSFADDARKAWFDLRLDGQGFASTRWSHSQTLDAARKLPPMTIYTNRLSAMLLLTGRPAYALLDPLDPVSQEEREDSQPVAQSIHANVASGRAVIVIFSEGEGPSAPESEWMRDLVSDLPVLHEFDDGIIYGK